MWITVRNEGKSHPKLSPIISPKISPTISPIILPKISPMSNLNTYQTNSKQSSKKQEIIPRVIYQTWVSKSIPFHMKKCRNKLIRNNPGFRFVLKDDQECRMFISTYYPSALDAFDSLIPGAYKADLYRYIQLYITGGIYLDIKFEPIGSFSFAELLDKKFFFTLDQPFFDPMTISENIRQLNFHFHDLYSSNHSKKCWQNKNGIFNGLMISIPKNPILKTCIDRILGNIKTKFFGYNYLYPTGPGLLGEIVLKDDQKTKEIMENMDLFLSTEGKTIVTKKKSILRVYPEYRQEQLYYGSIHYAILWNQKQIYRN